MAVKFIEPGGDADFGIGLWTFSTGPPTPDASTTVVHGSHLRSVHYSNTSATTSTLRQPTVATDAGGRFSAFVHFHTFPAATDTIMLLSQTGGGATVIRVRITSAGVLQVWDSAAQKGSSGSTLSLDTWYRLCFTWKITSSTVNSIILFKDGQADISITNATLTNVTSSDAIIGNASGDTTVVMYSSDHYIDDSNSLADPGDIWVTAKRPNASGTSVQFTTQIGAGGSGYGAGHSPQVNERPNSDSNGWSISTTTKKTEEYSIEGKSVGDTDITTATIIDYMGWIRAAESTTANTPVSNIIVNGVATGNTLTTSAAFYRRVAGSATYPAGTGTDIGMDGQYTTTAGTYSLYECGIVVAYIPHIFTMPLNIGQSVNRAGTY